MTSEQTRFCLHCGTQMAETTKFCQGCGKPANTNTTSAAAAGPSSSSGAFRATTIFEAPQPLTPPPSAVASSNLDNYTLLKQIYNQAAQVDPMQRDAYLQNACQGNMSLLHDLRSMFVTEAGSFTGRAQAQQPNLPESVSRVASTAQAYMIGVYKLLRELGRGGMGVVYLAVRDDGAFRKNVALKLLLREHVNEEFISRFKQERQVLAALDHPNIARILDGGDTQEGMPYYVMEYVEGLPLDRYCDEQRLSLTGRIKIFQQVCLAVDYLHQNSILHRDLKPSNILVSSDGVVKLLDFGIAKLVGVAAFSNPDLTTAQGRPMTPTYASPEQILGGTLTKTSDLYSLGAILYGLLTGRSAYIDLDDKLAKIAARQLPPNPSGNIREDLRSAETTQQFRRAMMGELDSIVLMAMQIDSKDRYHSAADLAQDLQRFLDGSPVTAHHSSAAVRGVKLLKRKRAVAAVVCGFLVLIAFGIWGWTRLNHQNAEAVRLSTLITQLQKKVDNLPHDQAGVPASSLDDDVRKLREAFDKDLGGASASERDKLLERGIKYLDKVHDVAPNNPNLNVEVGDTYQKLGNLQEKDTKSPNASHAALKTYEKAATTLASASGTERGKQHLADVNQHIKALGGTEVNPTPEAVVPPPPPPPEQPPVETADTKTPVNKKPPITPIVVVPKPQTPVEKPAISAETEDQLVSVTSKVQITDQTIDPVRQRLAREGETLNADTLNRIAQMHADLDKAKRDIAKGNEADAKENLNAADALATKILASVGR